MIVKVNYVKKCCEIIIVAVVCLGVYGNVCENIAFMCNAEKIRYIMTEHAHVAYLDRRYFASANFTCRRYGRQHLFYYFGGEIETLFYIDQNIYMNYYFYEFLTNQYKRSFVEMHYEFCHMLSSDLIFGATIKSGLNGTLCPLPPAKYHLYNMSIDTSSVPRSFPFRKGRIFLNMSLLHTNEVILSGYVDMEIKEISIKRKKKS